MAEATVRLIFPDAMEKLAVLAQQLLRRHLVHPFDRLPNHVDWCPGCLRPPRCGALMGGWASLQNGKGTRALNGIDEDDDDVNHAVDNEKDDDDEDDDDEDDDDDDEGDACDEDDVDHGNEEDWDYDDVDDVDHDDEDDDIIMATKKCP